MICADDELRNYDKIIYNDKIYSIIANLPNLPYINDLCRIKILPKCKIYSLRKFIIKEDMLVLDELNIWSDKWNKKGDYPDLFGVEPKRSKRTYFIDKGIGREANYYKLNHIVKYTGRLLIVCGTVRGSKYDVDGYYQMLGYDDIIELQIVDGKVVKCLDLNILIRKLRKYDDRYYKCKDKAWKKVHKNIKTCTGIERYLLGTLEKESCPKIKEKKKNKKKYLKCPNDSFYLERGQGSFAPPYPIHNEQVWWFTKEAYPSREPSGVYEVDTNRENMDKIREEDMDMGNYFQELFKDDLEKQWNDGRIDAKEEMAVDMMAGNEPLSKIEKYTKLTISRIKELATQNGYTLADG